MNLETYISELSKYVIASILVLYAIVCVVCVILKNEEKKSGFYIGQNILMFAFHFCSYVVICFETGEVSYLIFYAFQQIIFYVVIMVYKALYPKANRMIVNNICMLLSISCVILTRLDYSKALKQFLISCASLLIAIVIPYLIKKFGFFRKLKWIYAGVGILALGIVLILGSTTYGSKLSYSIAGITFQPSEFVKITFVFFVAAALYKSQTLVEILISSVVAFLHVGIQVLNKDLGSAAIFFVVYVCMLYIATSKIRYLLIGMLLGGGAAFLAFKLFTHVQNRVYAFLDPWASIDSTGYQITQSLFAQSFGGWFGLGLYKGTPNSIPFVEDDFIFSALTEEFGVIFGISLIVICLSIFIAILLNSVRIKNKFYQLVSLGFGVTYIFQVLLTIGGGTKFIPLTGVTLPLVSYGGSSVMSTIIMFAVILGVTIIHSDEVDENNRISDEYQYDNNQNYARERRNNKHSANRRNNRPSNRPRNEGVYDNQQYYDMPQYNYQRTGNQNSNQDNQYYSEDIYDNRDYAYGNIKGQYYAGESDNNSFYSNGQNSNMYYAADNYYYGNYADDQGSNSYYSEETYDDYYYEEDNYNNQYVQNVAEGNNYREAKGTEDISHNKVSRYKPIDKEDISYVDDDMVFLRGFTTSINAELINEIANEFSDEDEEMLTDDSDNFFRGEIIYSEEEYEKDKNEE